MTISIRTMQADDANIIVALWQETMPADPVGERRFFADYILDPHFDPAYMLIASDAGRDIGFIFGMKARSDHPSDNDAGTGIVLGVGVRSEHRRQGVGTVLFQKLESIWQEQGISRIQIGPWIPTYLAPGVDETAYPAAVPFLQRMGVTAGVQPVSMRALLTGYIPAPDVPDIESRLLADGVTVRGATSSDALALFSFSDQHFPYWTSYVRSTLTAMFVHNTNSTIVVAYRGTQLIGFALTNGERFGPFGVDESCRGQGVGAVLLSKSLCAMRAANVHTAYFLWTSDRTARLYGRHGFEIVRRFTMMTKQPE